MKLKAAILSLALLAPQALAETQADRDAIASGMDGLIAAISAGDFAATFDVVPPRLMEAMASQAGMSADEMRTAGAAAAEAMMGSVTIESYEYDLDAADFGETESREYALISTSSVIAAGEQKMRMTGDTLAIQDEGAWYLLRIEDPAQIELLHSVYPDMADVEISPGTVEAVQ